MPHCFLAQDFLNAFDRQARIFRQQRLIPQAGSYRWGDNIAGPPGALWDRFDLCELALPERRTWALNSSHSATLEMDSAMHRGLGIRVSAVRSANPRPSSGWDGRNVQNAARDDSVNLPSRFRGSDPRGRFIPHREVPKEEFDLLAVRPARGHMNQHRFDKLCASLREKNLLHEKLVRFKSFGQRRCRHNFPHVFYSSIGCHFSARSTTMGRNVLFRAKKSRYQRDNHCAPCKRRPIASVTSSALSFDSGALLSD